ncbi:MAG TPA: ABC transporter substrate-binding protein, partial [Chloroflexota bacterium]|nr:ABC transporter substrate-binding protein [Chloroflexota bacterium]
MNNLPINRRSALKLLAGTAGMALLAACGGQTAPASSAPPSSAPASPKPSTATASSPAAAGASSSAAPGASVSVSAPASAAAKPSAAPKTGGTLRFAQTANPVSIDGNSIAGGGNETGWLVFDRLTTYDLNLKPQPMLAESWDIAPDYKTFTLHLRKGVTYHSGRALTSDDVKYTILRLRDSSVGSGILAGFSNWFTTIDTPDANTIVLKSDAPHPTFFDAIELINIVDKQNVEGPDAKSKIVGTGPWVFQEWALGDHFSVVKNKNYWRSGVPYLDGITTYVRNQQNMSVQLEGG